MDDVDIANEYAQANLDAALARQRAGSASSLIETIDCVECSEEIPALRRASLRGCTRCIECQERHEALSRRGSQQ